MKIDTLISKYTGAKILEAASFVKMDSVKGQFFYSFDRAEVELPEFSSNVTAKMLNSLEPEALSNIKKMYEAIISASKSFNVYLDGKLNIEFFKNTFRYKNWTCTLADGRKVEKLSLNPKIDFQMKVPYEAGQENDLNFLKGINEKLEDWYDKVFTPAVTRLGCRVEKMQWSKDSNRSLTSGGTLPFSDYKNVYKLQTYKGAQEPPHSRAGVYVNIQDMTYYPRYKQEIPKSFINGKEILVPIYTATSWPDYMFVVPAKG